MSLNYPVFSQDVDPHFWQLIKTVQSPAAVAANTTAEQSLVVPALNLPPGLTAAQAVVFVNKPTAQAGLAVAGSRVIDATHIGVTFVNDTAGAITPTAGETYSFAIMW